MGISYVGIELNPDYAEMSRKRIANPDEFGKAPEPEPDQLEMFA